MIDIRSTKDFAAGHIVGALNIPHDKLTARVGELEKHKAKTIILVDAMGQTAGTHARELMKSGFTAAKLVRWYFQLEGRQPAAGEVI